MVTVVRFLFFFPRASGQRLSHTEVVDLPCPSLSAQGAGESLLLPACFWTKTIAHRSGGFAMPLLIRARCRGIIASARVLLDKDYRTPKWWICHAPPYPRKVQGNHCFGSCSWLSPQIAHLKTTFLTRE